MRLRRDQPTARLKMRGGTGRLLAGGTQGGSVQILDRSTGALVVSLRGHAGPVNAVSFDPGGRLLVSGSQDGTVRVWSLP